LSWMDNAKGLIGYNEWANAKLLKAMDEASAADLQQEIGAGAGTIAQGLRHLVQVQMWWFSVIAERSDKFVRPPEDADPLEGLEEVFAASTAEMREYGESVTEAMLERTVSAYHPGDGKTYKWPAWQLLTHLVNHSTHHRSELGRALGNVGHSPGDLDFIYFLGEG
jgi:uncharacterized damage-inducible protein DinB